jgi:hypothetical protein
MAFPPLLLPSLAIAAATAALAALVASWTPPGADATVVLTLALPTLLSTLGV